MSSVAGTGNSKALKYYLNNIMPPQMRERPGNSPYDNVTLILLNDEEKKVKMSSAILAQFPWADMVIFHQNEVTQDVDFERLRSSIGRRGNKNCKFIIKGHGPRLFDMSGYKFAQTIDRFLSSCDIEPEQVVRLILTGCSTGVPITEASEDDFIVQLINTLAHNCQRRPIVTAALANVITFRDGEVLVASFAPGSFLHGQRESDARIIGWQGSDKWLDPDYKYYGHYKYLKEDNRRHDLIKEYQHTGTEIIEHNKEQSGPVEGLHSVQVPGDIVEQVTKGD